MRCRPLGQVVFVSTVSTGSMSSLSWSSISDTFLTRGLIQYLIWNWHHKIWIWWRFHVKWHFAAPSLVISLLPHNKKLGRSSVSHERHYITAYWLTWVSADNACMQVSNLTFKYRVQSRQGHCFFNHSVASLWWYLCLCGSCPWCSTLVCSFGTHFLEVIVLRLISDLGHHTQV